MRSWLCLPSRSARIAIAALGTLLVLLTSTHVAGAEIEPGTSALVDGNGGCVDLRTAPPPEGDVLRCVEHGASVQVLGLATPVDDSSWQPVRIDVDIGWMASAHLVEASSTAPSPAAPLAGTIGGVLPRFGGTALVVWNGGPIEQLVSAAREQECSARSIWATVDGRFVGYSTGAPAFVNSGWGRLYPSTIPGQTPLLVVCAEVSVAMLPSASAVVSSHLIGRSVQGRPIEVSCVGEGEHLVLLVGGMHTGVEQNTVALAREIVEGLGRGRLAVPVVLRLCVIPVLNPDGLASGDRTNANGVDLNRNWLTSDWQPEAYHPASGPVSAGTRPLSEPETRILADFVRDATPAVVLVWHSYAALVEGNATPLAGRLGRAYARAAGLDYVADWDPYPITGQFIDAMEDLGVPAIDVELRWTDDGGFEAHHAGVEALLLTLAEERR